MLLMVGASSAWADKVHFGASTKDNTPWDDAFRSSTYTVAKGTSAGLNFTIETNTTEETWQKYWNWILEVNCGVYWLDSRGDNLSGETWKHDDISVTTTYSDNFETAFTRDNMDGASVKLVITRDNSNNVVITSTSTKGGTTWWKKVAFSLPVDDDMTFKLTAEYSYGTISSKMSTVGSYNFNDNSAALPFSIGDTNAMSGAYSLYDGSATDYYAKYTCTNGNRISYAYNNFSSNVSDATSVTVEFDFYVHDGTGHALFSIADANIHTYLDGGFSAKNNAGYGSNGVIFNLGTYRSKISGTTTERFAINSTPYSELNDKCMDIWCHAIVTIDNLNKKVSYTITSLDGETTHATASNQSFLKADAQRASQIDIYLGSSTDNYASIDNLVITKTVSLTSHTYTVNAVAGGTIIKEFISGDAAEGGGFSTYIPEVVSYNGDYYELDDASNGNLKNYFASYTMGTANAVKGISYTKNTAIAYYGEWETAYSTSSSSYAVASNKLTLSQGEGRTINKTNNTMDIAFTVPAGKYQIEIPYTNYNSSSRSHYIYLDGTEDANLLEEMSVGENGGSGTYSEQIDLTAGEHTIYVKCKSNLTAAMDYLKVTAVSVPKTITSAGWATYCSPYALDFSGEIDNLTRACLVTGGKDGQLELSDITGTIPANTGILLEGSGAVNIPVVASSSTDVSSNKLVGVTTETSGVAAGIYVLLYGADDVSGPVGFYKTANAFTIGANTAYLPSGFDAVGVGARSAYFFGDVTGIEAVEAASTEAAQKEGKFFKDGKLFIMKNGKKYSAAGQQVK